MPIRVAPYTTKPQITLSALHYGCSDLATLNKPAYLALATLLGTLAQRPEKMEGPRKVPSSRNETMFIARSISNLRFLALAFAAASFVYRSGDGVLW